MRKPTLSLPVTTVLEACQPAGRPEIPASEPQPPAPPRECCAEPELPRLKRVGK